jgi:hypothetical protein
VPGVAEEERNSPTKADKGAAQCDKKARMSAILWRYGPALGAAEFGPVKRPLLAIAGVGALAALIVFGTGAQSDDIDGSGGFASAGIAVARLQAASFTPSVRAIGEVLNPAPAIQVAGEIATAKAQVAGAKAKVILEVEQQGQAQALYKRGVLALAEFQKAEQDLANSQAVLAVDRANRSALLARTEAEWGTAMAAALRTNGAPMPQLAAGDRVLVGLSLPPGVVITNPPPTAKAEANGIHLELHLIGRVPSTIGAYPGEGILYQAAAEPGVPVGATVAASLVTGAQRTGVLVPSSAVTWRAGQTLIFRVGPNHRFEAVPIKTNAPSQNGYFVSNTLSPGDEIVVRGAGFLLGAGQHSQPAAHDGD